MPILLRIRNVSTKSCRENRNNVLCSVTFFPDNHAIYEIMSKNIAEPESQQTIWSMRTAWWITKATRAQAHALASTPTPTHTHAHAQKYTYCLSMARISWTRLSVTWCIHCLSCLVKLLCVNVACSETSQLLLRCVHMRGGSFPEELYVKKAVVSLLVCTWQLWFYRRLHFVESRCLEKLLLKD